MKLFPLQIWFVFLLLSYFPLSGLAQSKIIKTYVGPQLPDNGALAKTQAIDGPSAVAPDGAGGFYIASWQQNRIYRVAADGILTIKAGIGIYGFSGDGGLATAAQLREPRGVAVDAGGNLYIADHRNNRIRKVTPAGIITTVAGGGTSLGDGGPATAAWVFAPYGVAVDSSGNLYISEIFTTRIRKVTPAGIITTVAGDGTRGFSGDGSFATAAQLNYPRGIAIDSVGNLYIADTSNGRIRKVTPAGIITTVAGGGTGNLIEGGPATAAGLSQPYGVAVDSAGDIYIALFGSTLVPMVTPAGIIRIAAGGGTFGPGDGGPATDAQVGQATAVAVDFDNNLYIAEHFGRIRKVTSGIISTAAGVDTHGFSGDGGPATAALLNVPYGVAVDSADNLYIAEYFNSRIRKVTPDGIITTVAGNGYPGFSGDGGPATAAWLDPTDVTVDFAGNLYIADQRNNRIRKVSPAGIISTVVGNGTAGFSGDGGPATAAGVNSPFGVAVDFAGNLYIADQGNNRIRKVTAAGVISTVAGNGNTEFSGDGGPATAAGLDSPYSVTVDLAGTFYFSTGQRIRKVTSAGIISTVAGNGDAGWFGGDDQPATTASLWNPAGITIDSAGNLYIADQGNNRIRMVTPAGIITGVAGSPQDSGFSGDGGLALSAQIYSPSGVAIDSKDNLYIADTNNARIRIVANALSPIVSTTAITAITQTNAKGGGIITSSSGASVIDRGICWSTSANPTIANFCISNGTGIGAFSSSITGLTANTNYHVRAYAMNSVGTSYGSDISFITLDTALPDFRVSKGYSGNNSAVVTAGSSAIYYLSATGINGFSGSVNLSCSGLPNGTQYSIRPMPLSVSGSAAVPFSVTVNTTARNTTAGITKGLGRFPWNGLELAVILCLGSLILTLSMQSRRRLSVAFLLLSVVGLAGCGGGSSNRKTTSTGTPAGTYSVVLTATSGSISHSANLTMIVK